MKIESKNLLLKELSLWDENPRFPDKYFNQTEEELIDFFLNKKDFKIVELAEAVINDIDLPQLEKFVVLRLKDQFIVIEGNRRLATYKLLANPELTPNIKLQQTFKNLSQQKQIKENFEIECLITTDRDKALKYVDRKHNFGNFEVAWGQTERDNFKVRRGRANNKELFRIEMSKKVKNLDFPEELKEQVLGKGFVTTFYRIIDSSPAFDIFGFSFKNNRLIIKDKTFDKKLKVIIHNVLQKKTLDGEKVINTRTLNNKSEIENYLSSIKNEDAEKVNESIIKHTHKDVFGNKEINLQNKKTKKTPITKPQEILFGKTLSLKKGKVNNLYRAILKIYEQNSKTVYDLDIMLPILGMSMRLLLDIAAREYYRENNDENANVNAPYKKFLKAIKKHFNNELKKEKSNYLALSDSLSSDINFEALLAKYAHGDIEFRKQDIIKNSLIIADILNLYFHQ